MFDAICCLALGINLTNVVDFGIKGGCNLVGSCENDAKHESYADETNAEGACFDFV